MGSGVGVRARRDSVARGLLVPRLLRLVLAPIRS